MYPKFISNTKALFLVNTSNFFTFNLKSPFRYNQKSDMWSLGVLIYELATLRHPFVANDFQNLIVKIVSGKFPPIPR